MLYDTVEIAAIKIAVNNIESTGLNSKTVLLKSVALLRQGYERSGDERYLKKAVWIIYAYLELGFPFGDGEEEFREIVEYMGESVEEMFPPRRRANQKIPLNRSSIKKVLGKWNPNLHCMKIDDAAEDILDRSIRKEKGEYIYHCGKKIASEEEKSLWEQTYKLIIDGEANLLYDINKSRYYVLEEKPYGEHSDYRRQR